MAFRDLSNADTVTIFVDGVPLLNATSANTDRSKSIEKTPVIGTNEQRISEGSVSYSGSISELRENDIGVRLIRNRDANSIDFQSQYWNATVDESIGACVLQRTLNTGNAIEQQEFTALGNRLDHVYFLVDRTASFVDDLTVTILDGLTPIGTFDIPNGRIPVTKGWINYSIPTAQRVAMTRDNQYTLEVSVPGNAGNLNFYGASVQDYYLVGTGDGVETTFTLMDDDVCVERLFVRLDTSEYLGQLEGYAFSDDTGGSGEDEIVFDTAPANGVEVYAKYEYAAGDAFAWRLGFNDVVNPQYSLRFDFSDDDGNLVDTYTIINARFSSNGISVTPGSFVTNSVDWEGELEDNADF